MNSQIFFARPRHGLVCIIFLFEFIGRCHGVPIADVPFPEVIRKSDAIYIGHTLTKDEMTTFAVLSVLKGRYLPEIGLQTPYVLPYGAIWPMRMSPEQQYLIFVRQPNKEGDLFSAADPEKGVIEIGASNDFARTLRDSPSTSETIRLLKTVSLENVLGNKDSSVKLSVDLLASIGAGDSAVIKGLEGMAQESEVKTKMRIIAALIQLHDRNAIPMALKLIAEEPSQVSNRSNPLGSAIGRWAEAGDIEGLRQAAGSSNQSMRLGAAAACRRLQDPKTIPFLIPLLDDHDNEVQYQAYMALAFMTNQPGELKPASIVFPKRKAQLIADWKIWWEKNKTNF